MEETLKSYEKMRKKCDLPDFEIISNNFGVSLISENTVFHDILEKISEKLGEMAKMLESSVFIGGSTSVSEFYESKMLGDDRIWFEFYRELMSLYWRSREIEINYDEKEMSDFIKEVCKIWEKEIKPKFSKFCQIMSKGWKEAELRDIPDDMNHYG